MKDLVLLGVSSAYGFTPEELDLILNHNIKFRLGLNSETDEK